MRTRRWKRNITVRLGIITLRAPAWSARKQHKSAKKQVSAKIASIRVDKTSTASKKIHKYRDSALSVPETLRYLKIY